MKTKTDPGLLLLLSLAVVIFWSGCKTEDNPGAAPQLPPQSSFLMDFEDFTEASDTVTRQTGTYQHWGRAHAHVTIWNTLLTLGLAVPVASFLESFQHQPVYDPGPGNWNWSYNFTAGGVVHLATLSAKASGDSIQWSMKISKSGHYNEFEWYSGMSASDGSGGYWVLRETPQNPSEILMIAWNKTGTSIIEVKYTNIKVGAPEFGGFIHYGTSDASFNRFYNIFSANHSNLVNIEWHSESLHGRIKDPWKFGNDDWHCWDQFLQDMECR